MTSNIHFITLGVRNLKRSLMFYRDGLGFNLWKEQGDIVFFDMGGMVLALYPLRLLAEDANIKALGRDFGGITLSHNVPFKEDVQKTLEIARQAGGKILKQAEDTFWGGRSGYFADPSGYPWEIAWNPFIKISKAGKLILQKDDFKA
ncbi:MAG: VOC family protein [Bacteroidetes bacterium]|nr:VOC family protein [Bacteroidota bacterium]